MDNTTPTVGKLLDGSEQRDAIHFALAPVIADQTISPGQDVGFVQNGNTELVGPSNSPIGIVDPFLKTRVLKGERCWLFLYQQTITSLRHVWVHPDIPDELADARQTVIAVAVASTAEQVAASRKWMESFAAGHYSYDHDESGAEYTADEILEHAREYLATGDRHVQVGSESLRDSFYGDKPITDEFWRHFGIITGIDVNAQEIIKGGNKNPFCCTC